MASSKEPQTQSCAFKRRRRINSPSFCFLVLEVIDIKIYNIPKNYEDNVITASGKSVRNIIEAVAFFGIFALIFGIMPIPLKIKVVLIMLFGGPAAAFGYIGIKRYSVTEYLILLLKYKSKQNTFERVDMFEEEVNKK